MGKYFTVPELPGLRFPWYGRMSLELWLPLKQFVYTRDKGVCAYCGKQFAYEDTHCHHGLPLSEYGVNHPTNLKTTCVECHQERHEFMKFTI